MRPDVLSRPQPRPASDGGSILIVPGTAKHSALRAPLRRRRGRAPL